MYQDSDWIKAVSRLSKLTIAGALNWKPTGLVEDSLPEPDDELVRSFSCEQNERRYEVFEVRGRQYTDEDTFYRYSAHYLNIYKRAPSKLFQFVTRSPSLPAVRSAVGDLFRMVERAYAHQAGALDDLLGGDTHEDEEEQST